MTLSNHPPPNNENDPIVPGVPKKSTNSDGIIHRFTYWVSHTRRAILVGVGVVGALLFFVIKAAAEGIIGDFASKWFAIIIGIHYTVYLWLILIISTGVLLGFGVLIRWLIRKHKDLNESRNQIRTLQEQHNTDLQAVKTSQVEDHNTHRQALLDSDEQHRQELRNQKASFDAKIAEKEAKIKEEEVRQAELELALQTSEIFLDMDEVLFAKLAVANFNGNAEDLAKRIVEFALEKCLALFHRQVYRGAVYRPDASGNFLKWWVHYEMPQPSLNRNNFYIGSDNNKPGDAKRGEAGTAFFLSQLRIVRFDKDGKTTSTTYERFDDGTRPIAYRSFACIPMVNDNTKKCIGIICLDSKEDTTFDSLDDILLSLGARFANIIAICESHSQPGEGQYY